MTPLRDDDGGQMHGQSTVAPTAYVVDVCRYCGELAKWPGCPHWQAHDDWTMTIRVAASAADRRRLQEAMDAA